MRIPFLSLLLCFLKCARILAQCGTTDFNIPTSGCLNQQISTTNNSSVGNYYWDFCTGELNNSPQAQSSVSLPSAIGRPSIEMAKDGSTWYGFATGTWTNILYRLTYANGPGSAPNLTENLGSLAGLLNGPGPIRLIHESNQWYGITYNTATGELLKLSFGNSLSGSVTATVLYTNPAYINSGLAVSKDAVNGWVCVLSESTSFKIIRLGNSLSAPGGGDVINTSSVPNPNNLGDVDLVNVCGNWYGLADNFGNGNIYRLNFGSNLFSSPSISQIASISTSNPGRLHIAMDGEEYFLFVTSLDGTLTKLKFGSDVTTSPSVTYEGSMGVLNANTYGLGIALENSNWVIQILSQSNGQIYTVNYPDYCSASPKTSSLTNPNLTYTTPGTYQISLTNASTTSSSVKTRPITISSLTAPDISFTSKNICVNNNVNFNSSNQSGNIVRYQWAFGDGGISSSTNPGYAFATAGIYNVSLNVTANNGCQNRTQNQIHIFNAPQANFSLPLATPFCSNQTYTYTNTSSYDVGSNPIWQWSVNGTNVSTSQNLSYLFSNSSAQTVSLTTSIPGCSTQSTQNITTLVDGPLIRFNAPTIGCKGSSILFSNTTTDPVNTFSWSFGDGNLSSQNSASNSYSSSGTYLATLSGTNANGCRNSSSQNITIYSVPQPNFAIEAPPLSCANSPSQFDNLTPPLADSYISSWAWKFGDVNQGNSSIKNPTYTYSSANNYTVSLRSTTNVGCKDSIQKSIAILPSPQAGFINSAACINQSTRFTDTSTGSISSYQWNIQNAVLAGTTPSYVFKTAANYPVTLTVRGSNGCLNQITKTISVPVMPVIDFSIQAPCTGHPTYFQEINSGGPDPAVGWNWDFGQGSGTGSPIGYQFLSEGGYSVTMNTTRQSGCVYSTQKNVFISKGPIASFTPSVFAGAAPLDVIFKNTSTADSYLWQFGDAGPTTSTVASPEFIYPQLGKYIVLLTAYNSLGCSDTLSTEIDVVIPYIDIAMNSFSLTTDPNSNSSQALVMILNLGNIPLVDPEVLIDFGQEASVKQKIFGLLRPGKSIVQTLGLQIIPRSINYICAEIDVVNDANILNNKQCLSLTNEDVVLTPYPNPSSAGQVTLEWVGAAQEDVDLTIFTSTGAIAFERHLDKSGAGLGRLVVNTSSFGNGLYLLQFAGRKTSKTFRIMIAN